MGYNRVRSASLPLPHGRGSARPSERGGSFNGVVDETCVVHARSGSGVSITITSSFAQPARQDFILHFASGEQVRMERADDTVAMLQGFAQMTRSDPADVVRWRRNAAVYQEVLARIQRSWMQY